MAEIFLAMVLSAGFLPQASFLVSAITGRGEKFLSSRILNLPRQADQIGYLLFNKL